MEQVNEKIDKEDSLQSIKQLLLLLNNNVEKTIDKIDLLERKIDTLNEKIDGELLDECKKMGSHIDFVEQVMIMSSIHLVIYVKR